MTNWHFQSRDQLASCWDTWPSSGMLQWAFQCSVWTQGLQFLVNVCVFYFELYFGFYCELHIELFFELCFVQRLRVPRRFWARAWCCGNVVFKDIVLLIVRAKCIASHKSRLKSLQSSLCFCNQVFVEEAQDLFEVFPASKVILT